MRLVTFERESALRLGAEHDGHFIDLNRAYAVRLAAAGCTDFQARADRELPADMLAFLDAWVDTRARARDALLTDAIVHEEEMESAAADLKSVAGMDEETAAQLTAQGVNTAADLADLAVDELMELVGMDEERAKALIMTARAPMLAGA